MREPDGEVPSGEDAGPLVRSYLLDRSRSQRPSPHRLDHLTMVLANMSTDEATRGDRKLFGYPEYREVMDACQDPRALVDLAARFGRPVAVVRGWVVDLADKGFLRTSEPPPEQLHDRRMYEALLAGLREL